MGPEQDETKPAGVRQYATTLHPAGHQTLLDPPDPMSGEAFELEGLQTTDDAGNLVYLWSRLRPGLHAADGGGPTGLPLAVVQIVSQVILLELDRRLEGQMDAAETELADGEGPDQLPGLKRASRVVRSLVGLVGAGSLPPELAALVE